MTVGEIENDARLLILDTYEDEQRFQPAEVYSAIRKALVNTRKVRPESCYVRGLLVDLDFPEDVTSKNAANKVINMEDSWREAIVYYTVYQLYMKDDPDTQNLNLAKEYFNRYTATVMT